MKEKHYRITVHDLNRNQLCDLYDSEIKVAGEPEDIEIVHEREGWKEVSFEIRKYINRKKNFRCEFMQNENLIRVAVDSDEPDWYTIVEPEIRHSGRSVVYHVKCEHVSGELKTRNLFGFFDEENGIDTCERLCRKALTGSGWTLTECDRFFEADEVTEKIRSYECDEKTGCWTMLQEICELFHAYPIFHGENRTVEIHSLKNHPSIGEVTFGKNTQDVERTPNSSDIVTRLYVQGDYLDDGYVGIDDAKANTLGLNFICNFDYYKQRGLFTEAHQAALDTFLETKSNGVKAISAATQEKLALEKRFGEIVGTYPVIYWKVNGGAMMRLYEINEPTDEQRELNSGDNVAWVNMANGVCEYYEYSDFAPGVIPAWATHAVRFPVTINGLLMTAENFAAVAESTLDGMEPDDPGYADIVADRDKYEALARQYMGQGFSIAENILTKDAQILALQRATEECEDVFAAAMGGMLKEGYWTDDKYIAGQEDSLYADALDISKEMAFPTNEWDVKIAKLIDADDVEFEINQMLRIYDEEMRDAGFENGYGYVDKLTYHPRAPWNDGVSITTDELNFTQHNFDNILSRITDMAELLEEAKNVYDRASAIKSDGSIPMQILQGMIDLSKNKILSQGSNWYTDDRGNIIFVSMDGNSAMMLTGMGFMIANGKTDKGDWNWRTFGTGDGFTADLIVTGFLSADRIQAGTIAVDKLESNAGSKLDISSNTAITLLAGNVNSVSGRLEQAEIAIQPDSIVATVTNSDAWSTVTQTADGLKIIANREYGGSQLIDGTANTLNVINPYTNTPGVTPKKRLRSDGSLVRIYHDSGRVEDIVGYVNVYLEKGQTYTFSADVIGYWHYLMIGSNFGGKTYTTSDALERIHGTFTMTAETGYQWVYVRAQRHETQQSDEQLFFDIKNIKLEKGEVPTDWTTSANDLLAIGERVTDAEFELQPDKIMQKVTASDGWQNTQTAITNTASALQIVSTNLANVDQRVTNAELKITPSAIISTVTKQQAWTDLSGAVEDARGRLSTAETRITQTADNLTVVANRQYGGSQLLNGSATSYNLFQPATSSNATASKFWHGRDAAEGSWTRIYRSSGSTYYIVGYIDADVEAGKKYTFSADVRAYWNAIRIGSDYGNITYEPYDGTRRISGTFTATETKRTWVYVIAIKSAETSGEFYFDVNNPKLEYGDVPTAWEMSAGDLKALNERVSTAELKITPAQIMATVTSQQAWTDQAGVISSQGGQISNLAGQVQTVASRLEVAENGVTALASRQYGGAQLLDGSADTLSILHCWAWDSGAVAGKFQHGGEGPDAWVRIYIVSATGQATLMRAFVQPTLEVGKTYTISADIGLFNSHLYVGIDGDTGDLGVWNGVKRVSHTFVATSTNPWVYFQINRSEQSYQDFVFDIRQVKLEEGDVPTSWSMSSHDLLFVKDWSEGVKNGTNAVPYVQTSAIEIRDDHINIGSTGNVNVTAGGSFNVNSGSVDINTDRFSLAVSSGDSEVFSFTPASKTIKVDRVEASNIRPYIAYAHYYLSNIPGGWDGVNAVVNAATYGRLDISVNISSESTSVVEITNANAGFIYIYSNTNSLIKVPPLKFVNNNATIELANLLWECPGQRAFHANLGGTFFLDECWIKYAFQGIASFFGADVHWYSSAGANIGGTLPDVFALTEYGARMVVEGNIPEASRGRHFEYKASTYTDYNISVIGTTQPTPAVKQTATINGSIGWRGAGWNPGILYQGYSKALGLKLYGCMQFALPSISTLHSAKLKLERPNESGSQGAVSVTVYSSTANFGNSVAGTLSNGVTAASIAPRGAVATIDVTAQVRDLLAGARQLVLYTGEEKATTSYGSANYAKFTAAQLEIEYV